MQFRRLLSLLSIGLVATAIAACDTDLDRTGGDLGPVTPREPIPATNYLGSVELEGSPAAYTADEVPTGTATAPEVSGSAWFVRGGQMVLNVTVDDSATELYVTVSNAEIGYFTVPLSGSPIVVDAQRESAARRTGKLASAGDDGAAQAARISAFRAPRTVSLIVSPAGSATLFTVTVRSFDGTDVSAVASNQVQMNTNASSSAELQCSLNWIDDIDYDLHLLTPDGNRIYFAQRSGQNGGELDLDSNPACSIDGINNENITWASTSPAAGSYSLELDLWSACELPGPFPYLVTLVIDGEAQTFEGTMMAENQNDPSPRVITTFTID